MHRDNLYKEEKPPFWCNVHTCLLCACLFLGPLQTSWGSRGPSLYHNTTVRILQPWMAHPKTTHQSEPHPRTTTPLFTPPNPTMVRAPLCSPLYTWTSKAYFYGWRDISAAEPCACVFESISVQCICSVSSLFVCKILQYHSNCTHCTDPFSILIFRGNIL